MGDQIIKSRVEKAREKRDTMNCKWCYHILKIHVAFDHGGTKKKKQASFCKICNKKCRGKTFLK